jgi:hypothetical protein
MTGAARACLLALWLSSAACASDTSTPEDPAAMCQHCGAELDRVRGVRCGESGVAVVQCGTCCASAELTEACTTACEGGECVTACGAVEADPERHASCVDACGRGSCPVACGPASAGVDLPCIEACMQFLDCAGAPASCQEATTCLVAACSSGG